MEAVVLLVVRQLMDVLISLTFIFFKWSLIFPYSGVKSDGDTEAGTIQEESLKLLKHEFLRRCEKAGYSRVPMGLQRG